MYRSLGIILVVLLKIAGIAYAGDIDTPNVFSEGTIINADEMNANFTEVRIEVNDNNSRITTNAGNIGTNTTAIGTNTTAIQSNDSDILSLAISVDALQSGNVGSGQQALPTTEISGNSCGAVTTVATTGVTTSDVISVGFSQDPTGLTGYGPGATDGLAIYAYPTAGNVNFKVCNLTSSAITPDALTVNWRVSR